MDFFFIKLTTLSLSMLSSFVLKKGIHKIVLHEKNHLNVKKSCLFAMDKPSHFRKTQVLHATIQYVRGCHDYTGLFLPSTA